MSVEPRARGWAAALLAASACTFGAAGGSGAGLGEGEADGDAETDPATTEGDGDASADDTSTSGADATSVTAAGSVTNGETIGDLTFASAPAMDLGDVPMGHQFALGLRNQGDGPVLGIDAMELPAPLSWAGDGVFPGVGGDCVDTLESGQTCQVMLQVGAGLPGRFLRTITVEHTIGQAAIDVSGGAMGDGPNLVLNGGAEEGGGQLPNWSAVGGNWTSITELSAAGSRCFFAGEGQNTVVALYQIVQIPDASEALVAGGLGFVVQAQTRAYGSNDDPGAVRVRFLDVGGVDLGNGMSAWSSPGGWTAYEEVLSVPQNTTALRVELLCNHVGGFNCNAYFDEVRLFARYPVGG